MSVSLLTLVPSDFAGCSFCNEPIKSGKECAVLAVPVEELNEERAREFSQLEGYEDRSVHPGDVVVYLDWSEVILVHKGCINKYIHKNIDLLD